MSYDQNVDNDIIEFMDSTVLQALGSRWPKDKIIAPTKVDIKQLTALFTTPRGTSYYKNNFRLDKADGAIIAQFAAANGMTYAPQGSNVITKVGDHYPAWCGLQIATTTPMIAHEVKGRLHGYTTVFHIEYLPSSTQTEGSTELNLTTRGVVRITLPKTFPQIVIDSNKNDKSYVSTIPTAIEPNQKLSLEGNFAHYFDLFAPIGLQNETLTLLAPNFMQILIDCSGTFDVEFYGNEMILTTRDALYTSAIIDSVSAILAIQLGYMSRLMNSWNYTPKQQPFDQLKYSFVNGEVVKIGQFRLYPKQLIIFILIGFVLFGVLIVFLW